MKMKTTLLAGAVGTVLGISATGAHALAVTNWDLTDFNGDGLRSDFEFFVDPAGNSEEQFGYSPESGCVNAPAGLCTPIALGSGPIVTDVFTTGFNFGGTGDMKPNVTGNIAADITSGVLTFSALDWGIRFPGPTGQQLFYAPDDMTAIVVETLTSLGSNQWGVVVRYVGTDNQPGTTVQGLQGHWRLEGVMTTVPLPAAAWLLVSGLLALGTQVRRTRGVV